MCEGKDKGQFDDVISKFKRIASRTARLRNRSLSELLVEEIEGLLGKAESSFNNCERLLDQ